MTKYDAYPAHPLAGVPQEVLDVARAVLEFAAEDGDVDADMVNPLADAVVLDLHVHIKWEATDG